MNLVKRTTGEVVAFRFVDPVQLARGEEITTATFKTIYGLVSGEIPCPDTATAQKRSEYIDLNLIDLTDSLNTLNRLAARATAPGRLIYTYCSRCGHVLRKNKCKQCAVAFSLMPFERLLGNSPNLPTKVADYVRRKGLKLQQPLRQS